MAATDADEDEPDFVPEAPRIAALLLAGPSQRHARPQEKLAELEDQLERGARERIAWAARHGRGVLPQLPPEPREEAERAITAARAEQEAARAERKAAQHAERRDRGEAFPLPRSRAT